MGDDPPIERLSSGPDGTRHQASPERRPPDEAVAPLPPFRGPGSPLDPRSRVVGPASGGARENGEPPLRHRLSPPQPFSSQLPAPPPPPPLAPPALPPDARLAAEASWHGRPSESTDDGARSAQRGSGRQLGRVIPILLVAIAVLIAAGVVIGFVGDTSAPGSPSTTAFVTSASRTTLAQESADITLRGSISASGHTVPLTGSGQLDMASNAMEMNFSASAAGQSLEVREILVDGNLYMGMTIAGQDLYQLTGRHWVQMPVSPSSLASGTNGDNPLDQLRLLAAKGARVTALGRSTIDGVSVQGYSVVPTEQAMLAGVDKMAANSGLTPAQLARIRATVAKTPPPTIKVWIGNDQLLRRMSIDMQLGLPQGSDGGQLTIDFSNFGAPVHITPPASSDVMSYQQFLQALNR